MKYYLAILFIAIVKDICRTAARICESDRFIVDTSKVIYFGVPACVSGHYSQLSNQYVWNEAVQFLKHCNINEPVWVASGSLGYIGNIIGDQWMLVPPKSQSYGSSCSWPNIKPINRNGYLSINADIKRTLPALCMKNQ